MNQNALWCPCKFDRAIQTADEEITAAGAEVVETDEMDLSDLELESDDVTVNEKASETEPEELDLELDLAPEEGTQDSAVVSDSLDLSDLEDIIDSGLGDAAEETGALEMDLDLENDEKRDQREAHLAEQALSEQAS